MANLDKMKQAILKFVESDAVTKEVGQVEAFKKWLNILDLQHCPQEAIRELFACLESAEDRSKLALIDLIRLLLLSETATVHILNGHWETFDVSLFQYLQCLDIKDPNEKVTHNYHLISLKMLANIYQTKLGIDFISGLEQSRQIINFCEYSIDSCNPKVIFTAGVVLFNHVLMYKGNLKDLTPELFKVVMKITDNISKNAD